MISKKYTEEGRLVFGNKITEIEGWEEALESKERYVPHHVLEWKYSKKELKQMNRYDNVNPNELIWMPRSVHNSNRFLHKDVQNKNNKLTGISRKRTSVFGEKYYEHYGMNRQDNIRLYKTEHEWYRTHGKCRWEV
jgi:hypothetical protein